MPTHHDAGRPPSDILHFIASDVDLIYAVTGETIWPGRMPDARALSAFAAQIVLDRRGGTLAPDEDVSAAYLLRVAQVAQVGEANGGHNPFAGIHLEKALLFLARRQAGRIDVVC